MEQMRHKEQCPGNKPQVQGMTLLDVVIAIAVFALGVVAFAQYQASIVRSGIDARLRTMAANIAEETIETQRRFIRLNTDPDGTEFAYEDIGSSRKKVTLGGVRFTVTQTVSDYYWNQATESFQTTPVATRPHSDFKLLDINVAWENPLEFHIDPKKGTTSQLGSGSIALNSVVSSAVTATSRLALLDDLSGEYLNLPLTGAITPPTVVPSVTGLLPQ